MLHILYICTVSSMYPYVVVHIVLVRVFTHTILYCTYVLNLKYRKWYCEDPLAKGYKPPMAHTPLSMSRLPILSRPHACIVQSACIDSLFIFIPTLSLLRLGLRALSIRLRAHRRPSPHSPSPHREHIEDPLRRRQSQRRRRLPQRCAPEHRERIVAECRSCRLVMASEEREEIDDIIL